MDDIENLFLTLPDIADILIKMLGYVRMGYKALEYEKKTYLRKG